MLPDGVGKMIFSFSVETSEGEGVNFMERTRGESHQVESSPRMSPLFCLGAPYMEHHDAATDSRRNRSISVRGITLLRKASDAWSFPRLMSR